MFFINISNPLTLILLLIITVLLIFLGKEIKKPTAPAAALIFYLILLLIYSFQFANIPSENYEAIRSLLMKCMAINFMMIFITFIAYLWIDDIACKFYKKKSIDNSLDWFWNKI